MWWSIVIVSIASMPLAAEMAQKRERSTRFWFWIAFLVGPFAPLLLVLLGRATGAVPAN